MTTRTPIGSAFAGVILFSLVGCQLSFNPGTLGSADQLHDAGDVSVNHEQARLRMRALVDPMSGEIEQAADRIMRESQDPAVRRAALEWKSQAVSGLREALFQPRPVVALFDSWAFTHQMVAYFSTGPGATDLGDYRALALETSRRLERQVHVVAASFTSSGEVDDARQTVAKWAEAHPMDGAIAHRESAGSLASKVDIGLGLSGAEVVGSLAITADDLNRRLEVYSDQLLRQGRWEAELLAMDLTGGTDPGEIVAMGERITGSVEQIEDTMLGIDGSFGVAAGAVDRVIPLLERLTVTAESAPELIAKERAVTIEAVRDELNRTIGFARDERAMAFEYFSKEREIALVELHQAIIDEREILTRDIEAISTRAIDHAFLRVAQLVAVLAVVMLVVGILGLRSIRRMLPGLVREWRQAGAGSGS